MPVVVVVPELEDVPVWEAKESSTPVTFQLAPERASVTLYDCVPLPESVAITRTVELVMERSTPETSAVAPLGRIASIWALVSSLMPSAR